GPDQIVTLPIDVATLTGTATDAVGIITSYQWRKVSGPMNYFMVAPDNKQTEVTSMIIGTYQFELRASDNRGFVGKDTVAVFVHKAM
ncbi:MAG: PKD domain-containing protein, partial [Flavisolibacter sp.]